MSLLIIAKYRCPYCYTEYDTREAAEECAKTTLSGFRPGDLVFMQRHTAIRCIRRLTHTVEAHGASGCIDGLARAAGGEIKHPRDGQGYFYTGLCGNSMRLVDNEFIDGEVAKTERRLKLLKKLQARVHECNARHEIKVVDGGAS